MKKTKNRLSSHKKTQSIAEIAILLALATVLSVFKLYQLPYGGAFTLASMFPLILISYRHGALVGVASGFIYGLLQQLMSLSYIQGMTLFSALMVILLDYALAFAVIGLSGIFKKTCKNRVNAFVTGSMVTCILRYICHVIAGCTVWAGLSIPTEAAFWYSLLYNAAFMIPETIITTAAAYYLSSCIDFDAKIPVRTTNVKSGKKSGGLGIAAGLALLLGVIADTVLIFSHTQKESGEFDVTLITTIPRNELIIIGVITAVSVLLFATLKIIETRKANKTKE